VLTEGVNSPGTSKLQPHLAKLEAEIDRRVEDAKLVA